MVGGHLRPAAGEFDARGPRFGPGRVFRRVIGKKFEVGADGTRVVGGVFGVALSDGYIGSEVYGDSGAAFEMFDTIFQLLVRFQPPNPQGRSSRVILQKQVAAFGTRHFEFEDTAFGDGKCRLLFTGAGRTRHFGLGAIS